MSYRRTGTVPMLCPTTPLFPHMRYLQCLQRNRGQSIESVWDNLAYGTEFQHAADEANKDANTVRENLVQLQLQIQLMMEIKSINKIKTEAPLTKCDKQ